MNEESETHDSGRTLTTGRAIGGPLDEQEITIRFPRGFVAIDKSERRAFIYDAQTSRASRPIFVVRNPDGVPLDDALRWAAAESTEWDVVSV